MAALPHDYERFLYAKDTFGLFDDFFHFVSGDDFTDTSADAGASWAATDARGGRVNGVTGATDNNEAYLHTTQELFLVADNKPLRFAVNLQYTEANTDDANVFAGFINATAADTLVDNGAGMRTTGNFFCFFKVDGETTWRVRSRNGTETETNDTGITAGGANFQTLFIEIDNEGSGAANVQVKFFIDAGGGLGIQRCRDATTLVPITHTILIASSTEMDAAVGVKAGGANEETLVVEWLYAAQSR